MRDLPPLAVFDALIERVQAGATEQALRALRALTGSRSGSERRANLRKATIQILSQLNRLDGDRLDAAARTLERRRIDARALDLAEDARRLWHLNLIAGEDVAAAVAILDEPAVGADVSCGIFISYRREDSADAVGRMRDRLVGVFGRDAVFMDVMDMPLGNDFRLHVDTVLTRCRICLVVIGRHWLTVANPDGLRRLDDPRDPVRLEVEAALKSEMVVVPITVANSPVPRPTDLPETIVTLVDRAGLPVRPNPDFERDMELLIKRLRDVFTVSR